MPRETNEITVEKAKEILAKHDGGEPTSTNFFPRYQEDVEILGPGVPPQPVNPNYCLSIRSTLQLMVVLEELEPVAYLDPPAEIGGTFEYSKDVPWLTFGNEAVRNAGMLASYWNSQNGDPGGKYALSNALQDIAWG